MTRQYRPSTDQQRAYGVVQRALKAGRLVRASHCQRCGRPDVKAKDGRTIIHAHHHDYSKPLEVEWICSPCHQKETPPPTNRPVRPESRGEGNGRAKLTATQAAEIKASKLSGPRLAKLYGVHFSQIYRIKNGEAF